MRFSLLTIFLLSVISFNSHADNQVVRISSSQQAWPPFYFKDANNNESGLFHDLVVELFTNRLSTEVMYVRKPWARAQREIELGFTDIFITINTPERLEYATAMDKPFFQLKFNLFTFKNHPKLEQMNQIRNIEDLKALDITVISTNGNGWHEKTVENEGVKTAIVGTDEQMVMFLARKRADGFFDIRESMVPLIKSLSMENEIEITNGSIDPANMYIMVGKLSLFHDRLPQINEAWNDMIEDGTIDRTLAKYQSF